MITCIVSKCNTNKISVSTNCIIKLVLGYCKASKFYTNDLQTIAVIYIHEFIQYMYIISLIDLI